MVSICYIAIGVETYIPMTVDNIGQHCVRVGEVSTTDKGYRTFMAIIERANDNAAFDGHAVRAKMTGAGMEPLYLDDTGGVLWGAKRV